MITDSASGEKGHEELQLVMCTVGAVFTEETLLLIEGMKGKIDINSVITDVETQDHIERFAKNFQQFAQSFQKSALKPS